MALLILALWTHFILFPQGQSSGFEPAIAPTTRSNSALNRPKPSTYHLFGSSEITETSLNYLDTESQLNLILTGIMSSEDKNSGMAYIKTTKGEEKKFKVGDDVFGLAKLTEVHEGYLILSRGAKKERLSLHKGVGINTDRRPASRKNKPETADEIKANNIRNFVKNSGDWQQTLNQQKFDPNKINNIVKNLNVMQNNQGQITGLRVASMSQNSALLKQGLKKNDQIVAVNGTAISSQNLLNLRSQLEQAGNAQVTVMRNGRKINLNVNLSELQ